jgi:hypothetical protein
MAKPNPPSNAMVTAAGTWTAAVKVKVKRTLVLWDGRPELIVWGPPV